MEFSAIPIAFIAGILSLLSPCVLPMIPTVAAAALRASPMGLWFLAAGLSLAFAIAGSLLTFALLNLGIDPSILRLISAYLLLFMGLVLLIPMLNDWLSVQLSRMISHAPNLNVEGSGLGSQFIVGASLGLVWLPCVGPTLGTAIALASTGQSLGMAFIVMLSFGLGTALPLILLGYFAQKSLQQLLQKGALAKKVMGVSLLFLSFIILTGIDRQLEILALSIMPSWAIEL